MRTFFLYIRKYNIIANDYLLYVYKVTTDNIYRIIGKIYQNSLEQITRIDVNDFTPEREKFWLEQGYTIYDYKEPTLFWDTH